MRCSKCGAEIREGSLYCDVCGAEVRIVPDYSSLDEVLAAHVRGEIEARIRQNKEVRRRKRNKKKKMRIILGTLLLAIIIGFVVYQGSYGGLMQRGDNAFDDEKYNAALKYYQEAVGKNKEKAAAYIGMSNVYIAQKNLGKAEEVFLTQLESQPSNAEIYLAAAKFYEKTKQVEKIPIMLSECSDDSVLMAMEEYIVPVPEFSLESGTYEGVQKLSLSSDGYDIYYTLDETDPTEESGTKFGAAEIELTEKEWIVKAICVNEKGIPSLIEEHKIMVELPISDPPIVAPSSGLYEEPMQITVQVPEGFVAYYTFGSTEPTIENWTKYTGPVDMPEGNEIFSAILMEEGTEKLSAATVRNYDLQINE